MISSTKRHRNEYRSRNKARPFHHSQALHITMRSDIAVGPLSMTCPPIRVWVRSYIPRLARRLGGRLYHFSNCGNHLHMVGKFESRAALASFLRAASGMIARKVLRSEKGSAATLKFWTERPFSRLVTWGREFKSVVLYVHRNFLESTGRLMYIPRDRRVPVPMREFIRRSYECERKKIERVLMG